jgi:GTP-binding protein
VLFDAIIEAVPPPQDRSQEPLKILVNAIEGDNYLGRLAVGRIHSGTVTKNQNIYRYSKDGTLVSERVVEMSLFEGLGRKIVPQAGCGDLVCLAGMENVEPGDTIVADEETPALQRIEVDEPTLCMMFSVNNGPMAGLDGRYVTSRHIRDRLIKETRGNVSVKFEETDSPDKFKVLGRGELQLSVLIESMRREGYEMCVSRPEVVVKEIDGQKMEPLERLVINTPEAVVGAVTEALGKRRGIMFEMETMGGGWVRVDFKVPTRGLIGFRSLFLTLTRGEGTMSALFEGWTPWMGEVETRMNGGIVAIAPGKTTPYALFNLQPRGVMFIGSSVDVYEGMVIGEHSRDNDIDVQACREKKLTNVRASGKDEAVVLTTPRAMSLEKTIEWIDMDELVEVTPNHIRIRKRVLRANMRPNKKKIKPE